MTALAPWVAAALALGLAAMPPATSRPNEMRVGVRTGEATAAGTWDGTWMYVNRDAHFALWIRTKDGKPQVKVQYQSLASPESFETDWAGTARYYMAGSPAEFALTLDSADAEQIAGRWAWEITGDQAARTESARVQLRRTGYGRTISMSFQDYARTVSRGTENNTIRGPMAWTWVKVSKRELLWDELPW